MPSIECRVVGLIEIDDPISRIWITSSPPTDRIASRRIRIERNNTLSTTNICRADLGQLQSQLHHLLIQVRARM